MNPHDDEVIERLLGRHVMVWCVNYVYAGTLKSFSATTFELENPHVVYETGPLTDKEFKDAQPLSDDTWVVLRAAVESIGKKRNG